jgi:hypothetical protein
MAFSVSVAIDPGVVTDPTLIMPDLFGAGANPGMATVQAGILYFVYIAQTHDTLIQLGRIRVLQTSDLITWTGQTAYVLTGSGGTLIQHASLYLASPPQVQIETNITNLDLWFLANSAGPSPGPPPPPFSFSVGGAGGFGPGGFGGPGTGGPLGGSMKPCRTTQIDWSQLSRILEAVKPDVVEEVDYPGRRR